MLESPGNEWNDRHARMNVCVFTSAAQQKNAERSVFVNGALGHGPVGLCLMSALSAR